MKKLFLILIIFLVSAIHVFSAQQEQESLPSIALSADWVGRVQLLNSYSAENSINGLLYTYYNIKILDVFYGSFDALPLIIYGGMSDGKMQRSSAEYYPAEGEVLLLCAREIIDFRGEKVWRPVHAGAGLFHEGMAGSAGRWAVNTEVMNDHDSSLLRAGYQKRTLQAIPSSSNQKTLVLIRSMTPLNIHAGAGEMLTIDGFGFGDFFVPGSLSFRDANKGGIQYFPCPAPNVISWSDKQIRVRVPAGAGNGQVIVDNGNNAATSSSSLVIDWGLINTGNPDPVYLANAVKNNDNGGYEMLINQKFSLSNDHKSAFYRALETWRCKSFVNFTIKGETTMTGTASDEKNIVSWDDNDQLDPGVIGLCYCYYSSCEQGKWYLQEFDLLFRENLSWHTGADAAPANAYDFETVALHELGHAQQLSHVINQNDLMHYSLGKGQARKTPGDFNLDAVNEWFRVSDSWNSCNLARMQRIPDAVCGSLDFGFYTPGIYPNPCSDVLYLDFFPATSGQIRIQLFDLRGRLVFNFSEPVARAGKFSYQLATANLGMNAGIYLLKLDAPGYAETKKIIKY